MAETLASVKFGLANFVVSIGDYVTAKGAGTLTDVGITEGGSEIDWSEESADIFGDKHLGALSQEPHKRAATLKLTLKEVTLDNLRRLMGAVTGDLTGTAPNKTLEPGVDNPAQYNQIQFVQPGTGTTGTRTITCWRARRTGPIKLAAKKEKEQMWEVTFQLLQEITGSAPSSFFKIVDT